MIHRGMQIPRGSTWELNITWEELDANQNSIARSLHQWFDSLYWVREVDKSGRTRSLDFWYWVSSFMFKKFTIYLIFIFSRRICPGMWVAEREIWLGISRMLWAFRMEEIPGEPIDLKEYDGLSGRSPVPFRIRMISRHANVEKVLGINQKYS